MHHEALDAIKVCFARWLGLLVSIWSSKVHVSSVPLTSIENLMILIRVITIVVPVRRTNFSWVKWISGWSPNSVAMLTCLLPVLSRIGVREGVNGARLRARLFSGCHLASPTTVSYNI